MWGESDQKRYDALARAQNYKANNESYTGESTDTDLSYLGTAKRPRKTSMTTKRATTRPSPTAFPMMPSAGPTNVTCLS